MAPHVNPGGESSGSAADQFHEPGNQKQGVKRGCRPDRPSQIAREERLMKELKQKHETLQIEYTKTCTRLELCEETKASATKQLQQQHEQHMAALIQGYDEATKRLQQQHDQHMAGLVQQHQEDLRKQEGLYVQHVQQLDKRYDALRKQHEGHTAAMVQQHRDAMQKVEKAHLQEVEQMEKKHEDARVRNIEDFGNKINNKNEIIAKNQEELKKKQEELETAKVTAEKARCDSGWMSYCRC